MNKMYEFAQLKRKQSGSIGLDPTFKTAMFLCLQLTRQPVTNFKDNYMWDTKPNFAASVLSCHTHDAG